jgi:hypothetical protein
MITKSVTPVRTLSPAGAFLKATATNQKSDFVRPDAADRAVFQAAFTAIVRQRFRPDGPISEIARSVALCAQRHPGPSLPALDAEMLVRAALGESVPIADIAPDVALTAHVLLFASLADELALTDDELDGLIAPAERR